MEAETVNGEMHADAELLRQLIEDGAACRDGCGLTVKRIAYWMQLAPATIYDYMSGRLTIPVRFWRTVFHHCPDPRILALILGESNCEIILGDKVPDLRSNAASYVAALNVAGEFHEQQKRFVSIVKDGRIDEADTDDVVAYDRAYQNARVQNAAIHRAVISAFNSRTTSKGGAA
jgi:hypothetical protein